MHTANWLILRSFQTNCLHTYFVGINYFNSIGDGKVMAKRCSDTDNIQYSKWLPQAARANI
jgi:hypothetical protein